MFRYFITFFYDTSKLTENIKRFGKAKRSQQVSVVHVISPTYPFRLMLKFIATLSMDIFLTFWLTIFFHDNFIEKAYKKFVKKNIKNFYMEYILEFFFFNNISYTSELKY